SGISLEQGGEGSDEIEFELSLDAAESTPKPASSPADSDSEFELSLDVDDSGPQAKAGGVSDSEFELTLDDSNAEAPQHKAGAREKDIFETDFDVPNLEDSSGSEVAALDTDLDSSDFDLALQDSDVAVDEESGSQVVALDEEQEADQGAATVSAKHKPRKKAAADLEEDVDFGDIEEEPAAEEEEERVVVQQKVVKPAPWGAFPTFFMLPCVIVMVLVGIMGFEMLQHMTGYKPAGPL